MAAYRTVLLVLLMAFVLPVTGTAQSMPFDTHHDESPSSLTNIAVASEMEHLDHECCSPDASDSVCENGQECKTSSLFQLALGKLVLPTLTPRPSIFMSGQVPTRSPDIVWHPPRS